MGPTWAEKCRTKNVRLLAEVILRLREYAHMGHACVKRWHKCQSCQKYHIFDDITEL